MKFIKEITIKLLLIISSLIISGCANLASNKTACENADFILPLPYSFLGNLFQVGPCASVEALRIETGVEISHRRSGVESAIKNNQLNSDFEMFAYKMGCKKTVHQNLLDRIIEKNEIIFGIEVKKSDSEVVESVRAITKSDSKLLQNCW